MEGLQTQFHGQTLTLLTNMHKALNGFFTMKEKKENNKITQNLGNVRNIDYVGYNGESL